MGAALIQEEHKDFGALVRLALDDDLHGIHAAHYAKHMARQPVAEMFADRSGVCHAPNGVHLGLGIYDGPQEGRLSQRLVTSRIGQ